MIPKPRRVVDRKLLDAYHDRRCVVCGRRGCHPCHISSRGAHGDDVDDNLMPMCPRHHSEQHNIGWVTFARKYPVVAQVLRWKGWEIRDGSLERLPGSQRINQV